MQILISVLCTKGRSMRQAIADDPRIGRYKLQVTKEAQPGRAPGPRTHQLRTMLGKTASSEARKTATATLMTY